MPCRIIEISTPAQIAEFAAWSAGRFAPDEAREAKVEDVVRGIIRAVRERGDAALVEYTRSFDCDSFDLSMLRVPDESIQSAMTAIPNQDLEILAEAAENVRDFHQRQVQQSWMTTREDGTVLGQLVRPVDRVGLYVPGGTGGQTPLISSLIMNAVPAQVAGVSEIAVVTPPRKDGTVNPHILATAGMLGISEIYAAGSAWAIAALALGTGIVHPVDVIAGPGNLYVTTAKRLLMGKVGIDMLAGPSEITVLADDSANPSWLAADMLSQAEHDTLAAAILVTASRDLAARVKDELERQVKLLPRQDIAAAALKDWGSIVLVPNLDVGLGLVNAIAPEHLELAVADAWSLLGKVRHAGAVFLGNHCPEPVGDYFAGPNHVLPTTRTARFASALSVETFCKKTSLVATSCAYVSDNAAKIARLARLEGLEAHARSAEIRTNG
jgi:histidinol dehydrogenase